MYNSKLARAHIDTSTTFNLIIIYNFPEVLKLLSLHKKEGVTYWHFDIESFVDDVQSCKSQVVDIEWLMVCLLHQLKTSVIFFLFVTFKSFLSRFDGYFRILDCIEESSGFMSCRENNISLEKTTEKCCWVMH